MRLAAIRHVAADAPYSGFGSKTTSSVSSFVKSRSCGPSGRRAVEIGEGKVRNGD
jgi:hypothetical protein